MTPWLSVLATVGVTLTGLYLVALGGAALVRPALAKRFLGGFASSAATHFAELTLRVVAGAALISAAPRMAASLPVCAFGWALVVTSLGLALIPWRTHQRFAAWSVPRAMRQLPFIGVASIAAGCALLAALWMPRTTG